MLVVEYFGIFLSAGRGMTGGDHCVTCSVTDRIACAINSCLEGKTSNDKLTGKVIVSVNSELTEINGRATV